MSVQRLITEEALKKWDAVEATFVESKKVSPIEDSHKAFVTKVMLENQAKLGVQSKNMFNEDVPTNVTGGVDKYDPVLIAMVRRSIPNLIAFDIMGVQPMSGPTGLIFALRARYGGQAGTEALFNEADTAHSGTGTHAGDTPQDLNNAVPGTYTNGTAMTTADAEGLDETITGQEWNEMSFSIEKTSVEAGSRALRADYSIELAQDLKNVHGEDAKNLLSNILSQEIMAEMNREVIRTLYVASKPAAQTGTATAGIWDVTADSTGRWMQEHATSLVYQLMKEGNAIAKDTRRGRGNFLLVSSNTAAILATAERLDTSSVKIGEIDDTGNTFIGTLGHFKVYIDPYINDAASGFALVGYKGSTPVDAGAFYCPYVPMEMFQSVHSHNFQPTIGFKTRYGIKENPFTSLAANTNSYYRRLKVTGF